MRAIFTSAFFICTLCFSFSQNVGINTDGSTPETGVMLDIKGTNAINTTATQNIFQVKSFNASGAELKLRMILGTHATAGSRYAGMEVYDAGASAYRTLALQPTGGFVGVGNTAPATLFANTSVNTLDGAGIGISTRSTAWLINAQGYVTSLVNTDATASGRNGLLIKTAATDAASYPLQVNVGTNSAMVIRGDRNVGIGTSSPSTRLDVQGTSGTTLKIVDGNEGSGKVLTSDAAGVATWSSLSSIPGSCAQNVWSQFTAGTYTFTTSSSTTKIYVELWGGGGGGSNSTLNHAGGGGGSYAAAWITVTASTNYTVVVGAGGTNGVNTAAGNGGSSSFSSSGTANILVAGGGNRGYSLGGGGGTASSTLGSGNAILVSGNGGTNSGYIDRTGWIGGGADEDYGFGGNAAGAGGGRGGVFASNGDVPGGGGGTQGGNGASGGAIIRW